MSIQIALIAFDRFDHFEKALAAIASAETGSEASILVFIDSIKNSKKENESSSIAGNSRIIEKCKDPATAKLFKNFEYFVWPENVGCWTNKKQCVSAAFEKSDEVLIIEDDVILAKNALLFCNWAKNSGLLDSRKLFQLSLFSYFFPAGASYPVERQDIVSNSLEGLIYSRNWATPWGWYLPRKSWDLIKDEWNGWDQWVGHKCQELEMVEVAPLVSHCNNVGTEGTNRRGLEQIDTHLRQTTSDDFSISEWAPHLGMNIDEFKRALEDDLSALSRHSGKVYGRFKNATAKVARARLSGTII